MKQIITVLLFIPSLLFSYSYESIARDWSNDYIYSQALLIPESDLSTITQLVYLSYWRSRSTLEAQELVLASLDTTWKQWENIIYTRMNPSKPLAHPVIAKHNAKKTTNACAQHTIICSAYADYLEQCLKGELLESHGSYNAVKALRADSQILVSKSLLNIQEHIKKLTKLIAPTKTIMPISMVNHIKDFLTAYIPKLAAQTFIEADTLTNTVSHESWLFLKHIQEVSNYTWHTIETARSQFYSDIYDELVIIHAILEIPLPTPLLTASFRLQ